MMIYEFEKTDMTFDNFSIVIHSYTVIRLYCSDCILLSSMSIFAYSVKTSVGKSKYLFHVFGWAE